ncbi:MAG TPA: flavin reductase family protein [Ohtaekwangia sp.]|nr:flavin reductase family protein [Ohtaekwangia sp.]
MLSINPKEVPVSKVHAYLLGAVVPRPIAFASTIDKQGNVNLSPFSFFNCFGATPPLLIFSPARRGRDNTVKHTYENVQEVGEVVIHVVSYAMVQQMNLASAEFPKGVDEFTKSGFTPIPSVIVKPPRVAESPVAMECKVLQIIRTGDQGAAGNLVICEVLLMHIKEEVLDEAGRISPQKLDAVARLGGDWYCRVNGDVLFELPKPLQKAAIGVDQIPERVRRSRVLTGNDLGLLGNIENLPGREQVHKFVKRPDFQEATAAGEDAIHRLAQRLLGKGQIDEAWMALLGYQNF